MYLPNLIVHRLGCLEYKQVLERMQTFTNKRVKGTESEIWLLEHYPVFTQGQAGNDKHIINPKNIPVVRSDRGGQVTYHGPGQLVVYVMLSLKEAKLGVKGFVRALENTIVKVLDFHNVKGDLKKNAPGVYVKNAKIAAVGLRVSHGFTYHGLALNVNMDLSPFTMINPCGYERLSVTQTIDQGIKQDISTLATQVANTLAKEVNHQLLEY
tara:strand:- start:1261 stop:1893 length:633 start_codon:yes stop_codon:yes gene_type:complete